MNQLIDIARLLTLGIMLFLASIQDFKTREVDDKIWLVSLPIGIALTFTDIALNFNIHLVYLTMLSIVFSSALALAIYYFGLFGGADAKALICIAFIAPYPPSVVNPSIRLLNPIFPLAIFGNSVVLSVALIVAIAFRNLAWKIKHQAPLFEGFDEPIIKKAFALLLGYKVATSKLKDTPHVRIMEVLHEGNVRKFKFFTKVEDYDLLKPSSDIKFEWVWVTPAIPLLVFFLAGFICCILVGDLVMITVSFFL